MVNRDGVRHDMDIPAEINAPIGEGIDQTWSNDFAAMCQPVFFMLLGSARILRSGLRQDFDCWSPRLLIWSRTHCYMLLGLHHCFACSLLSGLHQYSDFTCFGFRQCSDKLGQEDRHGN